MREAAPATVQVKFAEHIPADRISGMVSVMAAFGSVDSASDGVSFAVRVSRPAKLPQLKMQLEMWETHGFLKWTQHG